VRQTKARRSPGLCRFGASLGGSTTLNLAGAYQLPQSCAGGQFASWDATSSQWSCASQPAPPAQPPLQFNYVSSDGVAPEDHLGLGYASAHASVDCPGGWTVVGGGYHLVKPGADAYVVTDTINGTNGWHADVIDLLGQTNNNLYADAICIKLG
jgi:hypothetical protein